MSISRTQAASAPSAAGFLDPAFGTGGRALIPITGTNQIARDIALQADGKLVIAGYDKWHTSDYDVILARLNPDGSLDASFGAGGVVTTSFSGGSDTAYALALQPDGKIVAAGLTTVGGSSTAALMRYNADGSLDTTFGSGGLVTVGLPSASWFLGVAVLDDGRIVAAGSVDSSPRRAFLLARYTAAGTPDATLGGAGVVTTTISGGDINGWDMALQPDGKIILGGYALLSSANADFILARYNADGSLDTAFGSGGIVTQDLGGQDYAYGVNVQSSGKIVAGGLSSGEAALARYNANGSRDTTFGPLTAFNYVTVTIPGYATVTFIEMALQANDGIVAATRMSGGPLAVGVTVFSADGIPNQLFGPSGTMTAATGTHTASNYALLTQPDGKVVLAGHIDRDDSANYEYDLAVWRFIPRGSLYLPLVTR